MEGELAGPHRGIIPRTVEDIFTYIVNDPEPTRWRLQGSAAAASSRDAGNTAVRQRGSGAGDWQGPGYDYLQIYNEVISDLLKPERTNLAIREDRRRGVFVEGLSEWVVRSPAEVYQLMERGQALRTTGATKLNEVSSRSHAVCIVIVEKCTAGLEGGGAAGWPRAPAAGKDAGASHSIKVGKLNLVDLAGSERVHVTGAVGKRLEESKRINASLSALGNVISALTDRRGERAHIPYRDSKLTRILEDSLGGNCRTTMICTIAPSLEAYQESLSSLKFANRAKSIKNEAHVNEDVDQRTLLRNSNVAMSTTWHNSHAHACCAAGVVWWWTRYERELRKLRAELQRRSKELVDKRALLEVEEQKRRAEADKLAALTALEKRSREFMQEKEEKRALEARISAMQARQEVPAVAAC
ncbi:kinesin-like protein [Haematococcus lacustris]|uniref:Kinesin-like protein n=1 Tax=Haematococcus lacustris TaxID=44745 RepID=A0A699Z666_HAELA|nr:kinesin-like protein [Haematococcus lacustris]